MKKLALCFALFISAFTFSCSSDEEETASSDSDTIANSPATGTIYGNNFTTGGGLASETNMFGVDSYRVELASSAVGCADIVNSPVVVFVPKTVGTHTSNVYVTFSDTDSDDYVSISSGVKVEITSIGEHLVGKIKAQTGSSSESNTINGTFDVLICN